MQKITNMALIALGSNISQKNLQPKSQVLEAVSRIASVFGKIQSTSQVFRTPAFPAGSGPDFANAVLALETNHDALSLLEGLHAIEAEMGRVRKSRWEARVIDLDLLDFGGQVLPDQPTWRHWADMPLSEQVQRVPDRIICPHPRIADRSFVLVPLKDVAPDWVHPITGRSVDQMLSVLPREDVASVVPWQE